MRRRTLRLSGFDYTTPGWYFVTVCTARRECCFGVVERERVTLSPIGFVARDCLARIPAHHDHVELDAAVVMPNHVHVVIAIGESSTASLGVVVATFKAAVSRRLRRSGMWQRGYYDHVIRDEADLARIREYVESNPLRWVLDPENPDRAP